MADRKPIKVLPDGGADSTGLAEFVAADTIGVADGGTGLTTVATSNILTGNGASALSAESNLTFDGTDLDLNVVTGTLTIGGTTGNRIWTGPVLSLEHNDTTAYVAAIEFNNNTDSVDNGALIGAISGTVGTTADEVARIGMNAVGTSEDGGAIYFSTQPDGGALTERLRIDSAGKVSINTGSPSLASGLFIKQASADAAGGIILQHPNPGTEDSAAIYYEDADGSLRIAQATDASGANATSDFTDQVIFAQAGNVGIGAAPSSVRLLDMTTASNIALTEFTNTHASFTSAVFFGQTVRAANSAFNFFNAQSSFVEGVSSDTEFLLRGDGEAYADGSWNASGADYQEWFESADGTEYEVGKAVVLDGDKVRVYNAATDSADNIMGITRPQADNKNSAVIGNTAWNHWTDKYLTDDWGVYIREDVTVWEWVEVIAVEKQDEVLYVEGDELPDGKSLGDVKTEAIIGVEEKNTAVYERDQAEDWTPPEGAVSSTQSIRKLNPAYSVEVDDETNYTPRADRAEWNLIGLLGQVQIKADEPTNPRWIKMKDISDAVELWMIR